VLINSLDSKNLLLKPLALYRFLKVFYKVKELLINLVCNKGLSSKCNLIIAVVLKAFSSRVSVLSTIVAGLLII